MKTDDVLNSLKELEHTINSGHAGVEHQPHMATATREKTVDAKGVTKTVEQQIIQPAVEGPKPTEQAFEHYKQVDDENPEASPYVVKQAHQKKDDVMTDDANKAPEVIEIETMMADDLSQAFANMTPEQQQKFKVKGEATAREIASLVTQFKATAKKILHLLRAWLKLIPGINKFFLEQEAKIKTDDILRYARKYSKQTKP